MLELMVVLGILAIVAAITVPRLRRRPVPLDKKVVQQLNGLMRIAQVDALVTGKLHRIIFDFKRALVALEVDSGKRDSRGVIQFKAVSVPYAKTQFSIEPGVTVDQFFIKGKNLITEGEGIRSTSAWFYIVPEGLAQEVTITMRERDRPRVYSFVLNPFTAQFSVS